VLILAKRSNPNSAGDLKKSSPPGYAFDGGVVDDDGDDDVDANDEPKMDSNSEQEGMGWCCSSKERRRAESLHRKKT